MKYYFPLLLTTLLLLFLTFPSQSQSVYSLKDIITLAQNNSLRSLQADNRKENRYWYYRTFRADLNPQLSLNGTMPGFNNWFRIIPQEDGDIFARQTQLDTDLELSLSQVIPFTGGRVFIGSQLQRIDLFRRDDGPGSNATRSTSYASLPVNIGIQQPIFQFNPYKWNREIEPIRFEESLKEYNEEMEQIALTASDLFFNLLLAQVSKEIASINQSNNDTIFKIAEGRYELGKIAENELLQLELNLLTSEQQVGEAELDLERATLALNTYIGNPENQSITLLEPLEIPEILIDQNVALEEARQNRQQYLAFKRMRMEAERDVSQARGQSGLNMNLFGTIGFTQQDEMIRNVYGELLDQQRLQLNFQIPILDWGRQKARIRTAEANMELVENTVAQEEINFEQEIYVLVKQFRLMRNQLITSIKADELAQRRYNISQQRYLVAKISITDLNIALQEKDEAKRKYLQALRDFWNAYYEIRMLTLYDFEQNTKISY